MNNICRRADRGGSGRVSAGGRVVALERVGGREGSAAFLSRPANIKYACSFTFKMRKLSTITILGMVIAMCILSFMSFNVKAVQKSGSTPVADDYSFSMNMDKDCELSWDWTSDHDLNFTIMFTGTPNTLVTQAINAMADSGSIMTPDEGDYLIGWTNSNVNVTKLTYTITYMPVEDQAINTCCCGAIPMILSMLCPILLLRRQS